MLKLPVWRLGSETFTNKFSAMIACKKNKNHQIHFDLYDNVFLDFDWACADSETFESILYRRCKQLREQNDYLRLFYSGGHDSHTMLLAFLKSQTHIDEIVVNIYAYWQLKKSLKIDEFTKNHPLNREQYKAAIPFLKHISSTIPKTKITIETLTGDYIQSSDTMTDTIQQNTLDITVDKMLHRIALFGDEKITGAINLIGAEKPRVCREDSRYYWYLTDASLMGVSTHETNSEMFYITPDMPELHRKQCHLMMSWIKKRFPDGKDIDLGNRDLSNDDLRQDLNDTVRWPLWHNESNLGIGKKIMTSDNKYSQLVDSEKTLQLFNIPVIGDIMDQSRQQHIEFLNGDSPFHYKPSLSYKYYLGR
jgi:hypothetical protein